MGSIMSQTSGVPYNFPINKNSMNKCAPGLTCLGDILAKFNYNQVFLCGSDADFAGRKAYFETHGNAYVLDYYEAIKKGYIDEDYYVFWGFEDNILFNIAKEEITRLAQDDKPFNFEMLTVDTHTKSGYICDLCNADEYDTQIANVIKCSDRQVYAFVEWCKQQDFYDDTIIIITGDHQLMNPSMVKHLEDYDNLVRPIYNCFLNCGNSEDYNTTNRVFTPMDIFPTTLSSLGFTWDGDYLGLGTNMFSSSKTLAEIIGYDKLYSELQKNSKYYVKNFS